MAYNYASGELVQRVVQANKDHQYALKVYSERLEAELEGVSKLLAAAEVSEHEDEIEVDAGGTVVIPGSVRVGGPVSSSDLIQEGSPFFNDAVRHERYIESITVHQWKSPELDALADAVRSENYRIHALEAQLRGQPAFAFPETHSPGHFEHNKIGIDWDRVAMKVSSSGTANVQRSAKECEIRWLGERHPQFNHSQWTQPEIAQVKELVSDAVEGQVDWAEIAAKLGTRRTPVDCMRHAITRRNHVWTLETDERLMQAVRVYGIDNWSLVAIFVSEDATPSQCQNRYARTLDPDIKRGPWTEEEDALLRGAVAALGHSWLEVASFIPGRSNEQCRDRYQDCLNPTVARGKWSNEEDQALLQVVEQAGDASWKEVSKLLGNGRTDNMCRSRYSALMKKKQVGSAPPSGPSSRAHSASEQDGHAVGSSSADSAQLFSTQSLERNNNPTGPETNLENPSAVNARPRPRPRHKKVTDGTQPMDNSELNSGVSTSQTVADPPERLAVGTNEVNDPEMPAIPADNPKPRGRPKKATKRQLPKDAVEKPQAKRRRKSAREEEPNLQGRQSTGDGPDVVGNSQQPVNGYEEGRTENANAHATKPVPRMKAKARKSTRKPKASAQGKPQATTVPEPSLQNVHREPGINQPSSSSSVHFAEQPLDAVNSQNDAPLVTGRTRQSSRLASKQTPKNVLDNTVPSTPSRSTMACKRAVIPTATPPRSSRSPEASGNQQTDATATAITESQKGETLLVHETDDDSSALSSPPSSP